MYKDLCMELLWDLLSSGMPESLYKLIPNDIFNRLKPYLFCEDGRWYIDNIDFGSFEALFPEKK